MNLVPQPLLSRIAVFTALMLGLGVAAAVLSGSIAGWPGIEAALWAFGLCWAPGVLILGYEPRSRTPLGQVTLVLAGTGLRVAVAAGGSLALIQLRSHLPRGLFLMSVAVLYLVSLAWETHVLAKSAPAASPRQPVAR